MTVAQVQQLRLADGVLSWTYDGQGTSFRIEESQVGLEWATQAVVDTDRTGPAYLPAEHRYFVSVDPAPLYRVTPEAVGWAGAHAFVATPPAADATCTVLGFLLDGAGQPAAGVLLRAFSAVQGVHPAPGVSAIASILTAEDGSWQLTLPQNALVRLETSEGAWSFLVPKRDASSLADVAPGFAPASLYPGRTNHSISAGHSRRWG